MDYEKLTKSELMSVLEEKDVVVSSLEAGLQSDRFTDAFHNSVKRLRCRLCVGSVRKWKDADDIIHTEPVGQPLMMRELPCRVCTHLRLILKTKDLTVYV